MGLDMYLCRKTYVKNWSHTPKEQKFEITVKKGDEFFKGINAERIAYIEEEVMYWRKANAIHKWFVDNVQDGEDNCKEYHVGREQLTELMELCKEVIKNPERAEELLPTTSGFFFGSSEYDEWYFNDLKETVEVITKLQQEEDGNPVGSYYYSSSW